MKGKNKVILGSALAIAMSASMIAGTTFALFTSESSVNVAVTSAKVQVTATLGDPVPYSPMAVSAEGITNDVHNPASKLTATKDGNKLIVNNMAPGDRVTVPLTIVNNSTIDVKYTVSLGLVETATAAQKALFDALEVSSTGVTVGVWDSLSVGETVENCSVAVGLPVGVKNEALMDQTAEILFTVKAIQGNAVTGNYVTVDSASDLENAVKEARTATADTTIVLNNDIVLDEEIYLNGALAPVTIDGNSHSLTASAAFKVRQEGGQYNLLKIYNTANNKITVKNLTLKHSKLSQSFNNSKGDLGTYHTIDIHTAKNVVLQNVTAVRDFDFENEGAPVVLNASNVTVKGDLKLVAGGNAWGGMDVDNSVLTIDKNANVSYLDANDAYDIRPAFWTEHDGVINNASNTELIVTENPAKAQTYYQIVVATVNGTPYANIHTAVAEAADKIVMLKKDIELNTGLVIGVGKENECVNNVTFDGQGHTISASEYFNAHRANSYTGCFHLVDIVHGKDSNGNDKTSEKIILKNVTLEHRVLSYFAEDTNNPKSSYHTLNIQKVENVTLSNVTVIRNVSETKGGVAVVVNEGSTVTVDGDFNIIIGGNAWGGVNVDNATLTIAAKANVNYKDNDNISWKQAMYTEHDGTIIDKR